MCARGVIRGISWRLHRAACIMICGGTPEFAMGVVRGALASSDVVPAPCIYRLHAAAVRGLGGAGAGSTRPTCPPIQIRPCAALP
jgi:hypothetical protein